MVLVMWSAVWLCRAGDFHCVTRDDSEDPLYAEENEDRRGEHQPQALPIADICHGIRQNVEQCCREQDAYCEAHQVGKSFVQEPASAAKPYCRQDSNALDGCNREFRFHAAP